MSETTTESTAEATESTDAGVEQQVDMVPRSEVDRIVQAEVNKIIPDRLAQQAKNKFGDYDELKSKAGTAATLEERLAEVEQRAQAAETNALRASVAAEYGVSTKKGPKGEPSDADLFLTGSDAATLTAQAGRLIARVEERKKQGNVAPKEGETKTTTSGEGDGALREFAGKIFGRTD